MVTMNRSRISRAFGRTASHAFGGVALAVLTLAPLASQAQSWPARPVRLIIPFAGGGGY
jgi:tripartite-type tricarboxylate transporter receptor subunit TctC